MIALNYCCFCEKQNDEAILQIFEIASSDS